METRIGVAMKTALALVAVCAIASATPAFAQTGAEYPNTMPGGSVPGAGSGSVSAPIPSSSGPSGTTVIPYDAPAGDDSESAPPPRPRHHAARRKAVPEDKSAIEPAEGHLKLLKNSYAYERPTTESPRVQPVQAGMFVNVIGTSRFYAQVKLKNSEIAYVPLTAIDLVKPADKVFTLTADSPVLTAPNHSAAKIAEVHRGRDVHVVGIALSYMKIRMKDGVEGFIPVHALE